MRAPPLVLGIGLVAAGCGGGSPPASTPTHPHRTIHVRPGRHAFKPGVLAFGDRVICGLAGASVPKPGHGVGGAADGTTSSSDLQVTVAANGTVTVTCRTSG